MKIHIIINEYGKESVDGPLLETLKTSLDEINNGSIFCSCKINVFEDTLANAIENKPECIVVEASGLADPSAIRSILNSQRFRSTLNYKGTICLADALRFKKVYNTARCVKRQLAASDIILLNKIDKANEDDIKNTENIIKVQNPSAAIYRTTEGTFKKERLNKIVSIEDWEENSYITHPDISLQRFLINVDRKTTHQQLMMFLKSIAEDSYRIKGFVEIEGAVHRVNSVGTIISIDRYEYPIIESLGKLVLLSGEGLPIRKSLKLALDSHKGLFSLTK